MSIYGFSTRDIDNEIVNLSEYKDKVLLIVNTATQCRCSKQFKDLEELYQTYRDKGFEILAFPCNQFKNQEPLDEKEIVKFCENNFKVTFQIFKKVEVNGENASSLFKYLKFNAKGIFNTESVKWNFTKFLVARDGEVIKRYAPITNPKEIIKDLEEALAKPIE